MSNKLFNIKTQYIKNISFENPNPIKNIHKNQISPNISIGIDIQAQTISDNLYETTINIQANIKREEEHLFLIDLSYAGIFILNNKIQKDKIQTVLLIDCPEFLFPFARTIIANITREGGFPPLILSAIDFKELYEKEKK